MLTKKSLLSNFIKQNLGNTIGSLVFGLLGTLSTVAIPICLSKFYQMVLHSHSMRSKLFDKFISSKDGIGVLFAAFVFLILIKFIFVYLEKYLTGLCGELFAKDIREQMFKKQISTSVHDFQRKENGLYLLRYSGDLAAIQNYFSKGILQFINDSIFILIALITFLFLDLKIGTFVVCYFILSFLLIYFLNIKLKPVIRKRRNIRSINLNFVAARLRSFMTIKILNRASIEIVKYNKNSAKQFNIGKKYYRFYALNYALLPLLMNVLIILVFTIIYFSNGPKIERKETKNLLVFVMLLVNLIPVIKRLLRANFAWQSGDVSLTNLLRILNLEEEERLKSKKLNWESVTFKDVSFVDTEGKIVLNSFNITLSKNQLILLTGDSGTGKSLLINMLCGLVKPSKGEILIDDHNLNSFNGFDLRRHIVLSADELNLIGKTVFEAASYSREMQNRSACYELLSRLEFSKDSESKLLDFPLFDGGINLPSGKRKIIQIARALLTKKKIMVFENPFSNLDIPSQSSFISTLQEIKEKHIIIIVENKPSSNSAKYDQIINLNHN